MPNPPLYLDYDYDLTMSLLDRLAGVLWCGGQVSGVQGPEPLPSLPSRHEQAQRTAATAAAAAGQRNSTPRLRVSSGVRVTHHRPCLLPQVASDDGAMGDGDSGLDSSGLMMIAGDEEEDVIAEYLGLNSTDDAAAGSQADLVRIQLPGPTGP